jgi:hypothetical protein
MTIPKKITIRFDTAETGWENLACRTDSNKKIIKRQKH